MNKFTKKHPFADDSGSIPRPLIQPAERCTSASGNRTQTTFKSILHRMQPDRIKNIDS